MILAWVIGSGLLPGALLRNLQPDRPVVPEWKPRNAIVLLGVGTTRWPSDHVSTATLGFARLHEAARLYRTCKTTADTCRILASGGDPKQTGHAEAEVMKEELTQIGVPAADIVTEEKSNTTFQNAHFSSEVLKAQKFDQTILVTSGVHVKRSLLYFGHFGIQALGAPADYLEAPSTIIPVAFNFTLTDIALHEYAGIARKGVYDLIGWNAENPQPGTP